MERRLTTRLLPAKAGAARPVLEVHTGVGLRIRGQDALHSGGPHALRSWGRRGHSAPAESHMLASHRRPDPSPILAGADLQRTDRDGSPIPELKRQLHDERRSSAIVSLARNKADK